MKVEIIDDKNNSFIVNLDDFGKDVVSFGRHPESDIKLNAEFVSRVHGCFYLEYDVWHVKDLDSTYGIVCLSNKIDSMILKPGDVLKINSNSGEYIHMRILKKESQAPMTEKSQANPVTYSQPLGMMWYNFLIWIGLFLFALTAALYSISFLQVITIDTTPRYEYQEYMDEETIDFLDEVSHEMGVDRKWEEVNTTKWICFGIGLLIAAFAIETIIVRFKLAGFKKGATKEYLNLIGIFLVVYIIALFGAGYANYGEDFLYHVGPMYFIPLLFMGLFYCANKTYFEKREHLFIN